jgi:hypothetical protein
VNKEDNLHIAKLHLQPMFITKKMSKYAKIALSALATQIG